MSDDLRRQAALAALPELIRNELMMARGEKRPISWPAVAEDCFLLADAFVIEATGVPAVPNVQNVATCVDGYVRHRWTEAPDGPKRVCERCGLNWADWYEKKYPAMQVDRTGRRIRRRAKVVTLADRVG